MTRGLVAAYRELDALIDGIEALKKKQFSKFTVYTPTPRHEIEHVIRPPTSKVRRFTLIGGLLGVTFGYWIAIWTSEYWPLVVGGKPHAAWIPYTIIGFELNILFGGLATVAGLLIHGFWVHRKRDHAAYQPSFSGDEFGCLVECSPDKVGRAQEVLRDAGCAEVRVLAD